MSNPLRLGVAGLGVVGTSLVRLLQRQDAGLAKRVGRGLAVTAFSARRKDDRGVDLGGAAYFASALELASTADIDIFVELIGGAEGVAFDAVKAALSRGTSVVTANKAMLAAHGFELATIAEQSGAQLFFEAAVGGGIPVIKTLRESLAGNAIRRVSGILNGTCNYILSRMETERLPFEVCLNEAQRLGYAEADPTFDVGGFDTAHKLAILASLAFGARIDAGAVSVEGIETITLADLSAADELGFRIKLLGVAERTAHGVEQRVHPTMVAKSAPLAQTMGVLNAVSIDGDAIGELTLVGPGQGAMRPRRPSRQTLSTSRAGSVCRPSAGLPRRWLKQTACRCSGMRAAITCASPWLIVPAPWVLSRRAWASSSSRSKRSCKSGPRKKLLPPGSRRWC